MTPKPEDLEPAWKHKLRAAALLALQRRDAEQKKRELADMLRDLARRDAEKISIADWWKLRLNQEP